VVNLALSAARNLTVEVASFAAAPALNDTQGARNATAPLRLPLAAAPANSATNVSGWRWDPLAPRGGGGGGGRAGAGAVWFVFLWLRDAGGGLLSRNACAPPRGVAGSDIRLLRAWPRMWSTSPAGCAVCAVPARVSTAAASSPVAGAMPPLSLLGKAAQRLPDS